MASSTTADGRCFDCVRRRRWYPHVDLAIWIDREGLRHLPYAEGLLCELPKRPRDRDPEKVRGYERAYTRRMREQEPERWSAMKRRKHLWQHYRLRPDDFDAMLVAQGGVCGCCHHSPATVVDHDRKCCPGSTSCGQCVRALLCSPCNLLIGIAQEDPATLRAAAIYVER